MEYEQVGVIGIENYPLLRSYFDGENHHQAWAELPRTIPLMFKDLPAGTMLYVAVGKEEQKAKG